MSEGKIRCIIKRPDEPVGHVTNISTRLENLQRIVGGYIEVVRMFEDMVIICDEEGRLKRKPFNTTIVGTPFFGEIIAVGYTGKDFKDLDISLKDWKQFFLGPNVAIRMEEDE